ncbi:MAG: hypothetical protein WCS65_07445 [Verrucomicrobiae bacterium]
MKAILPPAPASLKPIQPPMFRRVSPVPEAAPAPGTSGAGAPPTTSPEGIQPAMRCLGKLALDDLAAGDKVVVKTANSTYRFEMIGALRCNVLPSKPSARSGEAILAGGLNDEASEHTPNRVFVGGRLAYQFPDEEACIMTSVVESILLVPAMAGQVA